MTRKMFQVSRIGMIVMVAFVCFGLISDEKILLLDENIYQRCLIQALSLAMFLIISHLYENKRKMFSTGYIFLLVNYLYI